MAILAVCWALWLERNSRVFEDTFEGVDFIWDMVKFWIAIWAYDSKHFKTFPFSVLYSDWCCWM